MMGYPIFLQEISASSTLCKQACSIATHGLTLQRSQHPQQPLSFPWHFSAHIHSALRQAVSTGWSEPRR